MEVEVEKGLEELSSVLRGGRRMVSLDSQAEEGRDKGRSSGVGVKGTPS